MFKVMMKKKKAYPKGLLGSYPVQGVLHHTHNGDKHHVPCGFSTHKRHKGFRKWMDAN